MIEIYPWLPHRRALTYYYRPQPSQLPDGQLRVRVFDFPALANLETGELAIPFDSDSLIWAFTGNSILSDGVTAGTYRVQMTHRFDGKERSFFDKHQMDANVIGTARRPFLLRETQLCRQSDSLLVEVKNLDSTAGLTAHIQVVAWLLEIA